MVQRRIQQIRLGILIGTLFAALLAGGITIIIMVELKMTRLVPGGLGESFSTRIYSAPASFGEGTRHSPEWALLRLKRLNYLPTKNLILEPGQYRWEDPLLTVHVRGFRTPLHEQAAGVAVITHDGKGNWTAATVKGDPLSSIFLEPELATELSGPNKVRRDPATWEEFPPVLLKAVVAVEDRRFFKHPGIDPRAIARAAWFNLRKGKKLQGGSTITQQLSKNLFLTHKRTMRRKAVEAAFALYLDFRYSKEKLLTLYLNQIYMGQDGFVSVAGMKSAARFYFNKNVSELNLSEAAVLAGLIRSPYRYNPLQNPEAAMARRDTVLHVMVDEGMISEAEAQAAKKMTMGKPAPAGVAGVPSENDYFTAQVVRHLIPRYSEDMLFRYGLVIHTTLDPVLQKQAYDAIQPIAVQGALVAIEPASGRVLALIGGKNYRESQFNRATQARRQPGSAFKPFVFGAGLEQGFTPASLLNDEPRAYTDNEGNVWAPQNFDRTYRGQVTFRDALAQSLNAASLDLAHRVGASTVVRFARKMGIESDLERSLAVALGTSEVSPLEITMAYAPFANGGFRVEPMLVTAVVDAENNILELNTPERTQVLEPGLAYLMTSLLGTTVESGTAKGLLSLGWKYPASGKTGTTNLGRDGWFIGYTPELAVGVWVGVDDATPAQLSGAKSALPVWARFANAAYKGIEPSVLEKPQGIMTMKIDPISGLRARSGCPDRREEVFLAGTEPSAYCAVHSGGIKGWFQRLLRGKTEAPGALKAPPQPVED